jgi:hypothetical protein
MARSNVCRRVAVGLLACVMSSGVCAFAQSTFGSIVGTVKDQSGSVVPGRRRYAGEPGEFCEAYGDHQCFGKL